MIRVGVVGATGYAGAEVVRLLTRHPQATITILTSGSSAGKQAHEPAPQLRGLNLPTLEKFDIKRVAEACDVAFLAQESGFAIRHARSLLDAGIKIIDLSADFRLDDPLAYPKWYKMDHTESNLLGEALFGMCELTDHSLYTKARLVANPGCYPTGSSLAVAPLIKAGLGNGTIVIDAKSGVSGAGRSKISLDYHFCEIEGSFKAYNPVAHRHVPEIEQTLKRLSGSDTLIRFTPHLMPIARGIFTTAYVPIKEVPVSLTALYEEFYRGQPFVQVLPEGQIPATKHVFGSNSCHVSVTFDPRTNYAVCFSVIDNLVKGAAGQAVQNMNLLFGLDETCGLDIAGIYP